MASFNITRWKAILAIVMQIVQYLIVIFGATSRFIKYKDIGRFNRNTQWPKTYKWKLTLQLLELTLALALLVVYLYVQSEFKWREASFAGQVILWTLSISLHLFEYYRQIGHVWYLHPLLWLYSFF